MTSATDSRSYFTTGEVAKFCEVTIPTVKNWIKKGLLRTTKTPGGINRIRKEDFIEFMHTSNVVVTDFPLPTPRLLVISDDADLCTFVGGVLGEDDYETYATRSAFNACLEAGANPPDLVLLDVEHPNTGELLACFAACEAMRRTRVLLLVDDPEVDGSLKRRSPQIASLVPRSVTESELRDHVADYAKGTLAVRS